MNDSDGGGTRSCANRQNRQNESDDPGSWYPCIAVDEMNPARFLSM